MAGIGKRNIVAIAIPLTTPQLAPVSAWVASFNTKHSGMEDYALVEDGVLRIAATDVASLLAFADPALSNELDLHRFRKAAIAAIQGELVRRRSPILRQSLESALKVIQRTPYGEALSDGPMADFPAALGSV